MERSEYETMASVEDRHFWFVATRAIVKDAVLAAGIRPDSAVLDVGCGTGGTMKALAGCCLLTGVEPHPPAAELAASRSGRPVVAGNALDLPFANGSFDGALCLDVFEHIVDDRGAIEEIRRIVRPGGVLVATVPCHPWLFSEHDEALHHVRRYTRKQFVGLLRRGGFVPERVTWINSFLFPVAAAHRLASRLLADHDAPARSDAAVRLGPFNEALKAVFLAERRVLALTDLPFGLGLLAVAR